MGGGTADARQRAALLLTRAREAESTLRLVERTEALDDLFAMELSHRETLETAAERAIDLARTDQVDAAEAAARAVLRDAGPGDELAVARATEALGRALAWQGTASASGEAGRHLAEAAARYAALDETDWQAWALFWRGNAVHYQLGEPQRARELTEQALSLLAPTHPRRPTMLSFYGDTLVDLGELAAAEAVLDDAWNAAAAIGEAQPRAYVQWSRARLASVRGDSFATQRQIHEVERDIGDWFDIHTGAMFLADAAELLDRVGLRADAEHYLARALVRDPQDEFVRQGAAVLAARGGEPISALETLQALASYDWLEKRIVWRVTALTAYATFRAGRTGAGDLAASALEQAASTIGVRGAVVGEAEIMATLLPLAEAAGSRIARAALTPADGYLVRVLGPMRVHDCDGEPVELPAGLPAELVRLLAINPHGLHVEQLVEEFFPDVAVATGRHRLRQVLTRLRSSAGPLVIRDGELLRLAAAWVDVRAFSDAADRVRGAPAGRRARAALVALAAWDGPALPADIYASWARGPRDRLERRHLALLDLLADDAEDRGSHEEALTALTVAIDHDPTDPARYLAAAHHLRSLGRTSEAARLVRAAQAHTID